MSNCYCIFCALYAPHVGGVENYTANLARELHALGNQVYIVTNNTENAAPHQVCDYAEIYRLPCSGFMGGRFPLTKQGPRFQELWNAICSKPINRVVVNTRFYPISLLGVRFAAGKGLVPVVIDHGSAHLTVGNPLVDVGVRKVEHTMTARLKCYPARYFGVSRKSVEWLGHFGIQGEGVLNNSIDAPAFRAQASERDFAAECGLPEGALRVAFTGRLAPEKGVQQLVDAAALLGEDVQVLVAGKGVLMQQLQAKAGPNVHLLGALGPADVAALLLQCDAFCLPSRSEGFSTSLLEAAACACAPVISRVGGVDELLVGPDYGTVLEDTDPETIAAALQDLAQNHPRCEQIARNAQARVESEFTWKRSAQKVEAAFE